MRVLLLGGTGCLSGAVAAWAAGRGDVELYLLNRGRRPWFVPEGAHCLRGDLAQPEEIRALTAGLEFDVVTDFLSYTVDQLEATLGLFQERCGQFMFISSAAVYWPRHFNEILTEAGTPAGNTLWSYARNKILCERRLAEEREQSGLNYTVVRPAFTYNHLRLFHPIGPGHQEYSWTLAQRILEGKPLLMMDDGTALCTLTYAPDFAEACGGLMGNPQAYGEAFHLTSDEWLTFNRAAEMLGEALGVPTKLCHLPAHILGLELGGDFGEKLLSFARGAAVDSSKVRKLVPEFADTTSYAEGLRKCLEFYEAHPEFKVVSPEWDATMDRLVAKYGGRS
jgi:nucleoside-diphosphate-sugar epimerase